MANSAPPAHDRDPYADRRAFPRVALALPAFLQVDAKRHSVQLVDLSAGGAKLICAATIPVGTAVTLDCGSFAYSAVVRWQTGGHLGLCFDSELDAREVSALADRSRALAALMKAKK